MSDLKNPIEEKLNDGTDVIGRIHQLDDLEADESLPIYEEENPSLDEEDAVRKAEAKAMQQVQQVVNFASQLLLEHVKKLGLATAKSERIKDSLRVSDEFLAMSEDYASAKMASAVSEAVGSINLEAGE